MLRRGKPSVEEDIKLTSPTITTPHTGPTDPGKDQTSPAKAWHRCGRTASHLLSKILPDPMESRARPRGKQARSSDYYEPAIELKELLLPRHRPQALPTLPPLPPKQACPSDWTSYIRECERRQRSYSEHASAQGQKPTPASLGLFDPPARDATPQTDDPKVARRGSINPKIDTDSDCQSDKVASTVWQSMW